EASLKDSAGNTNTSTATGNTVADSAGNSTATTAAGNTVKDSSGNSSVYGASGSTLTDKAGNTTVVDTKGLSFKDTTGAVTGPSITASGVNAGGKAVTNVGDAVNSTDAVNKKLLDEATSAGSAKTDASGNSTASALGGGSTYDPTTGTVSAPTYSVNSSSKNNVGDAISALDQGFTVTSNGANGKAIKAGDTLEIGTADGEKNLTVSKDGNTIKYGLNRNLDLDSVKAGNTTLNNVGVAVDDGTGNVSKLTTAGTTVADSAGNNASYGAKEASLKDSAGNSTSTTASGTNVADKNGNSNSLTATGNTIKDNAGNSTTSSASGVTVADGLGNSTAVTATGVNVAGGPSLTKTGLDVAGGTITNLKGGQIATGSTDAVTGGQVAEVQSQLQKQLGSVGDSAVQYAQNSDGTTNYDSILAGNGKGTTATLGTDSYGNSIVTGGGTTISNVANAVKASDAVNKGQLDSAISSNITDVKDGNGNGVSVTDQVVNRNYNATNPDPDSLFLTYNKAGQTTTDNLTIGETVQKMNKEGVKFAHTNAATEAKDSSAGGTNSTALGVNAIASTDAANSVVIGNNSSVSGTSSVAIGDGATASGTQSISIG
ncbi:Head domain of trimeric autotransporter adhesin, partial [Acinetobacter boissieri]